MSDCLFRRSKLVPLSKYDICNLPTSSLIFESDFGIPVFDDILCVYLATSVDLVAPLVSNQERKSEYFQGSCVYRQSIDPIFFQPCYLAGCFHPAYSHHDIVASNELLATVVAVNLFQWYSFPSLSSAVIHIS